MKKLTIAIPTFNREIHLRSKIDEISHHVIENDLAKYIDLMVVDNCSNNYDIEKLKNDYSAIDFLIIHKNMGNIGAGANFLRCIELANSEFVWLLGDDENLDLQGKNSISLLNKMLEQLKNSDCYLLPHNESYAKTATYWGVFLSIDDILDKFFNLGSFFVLSIYIFNREIAIRYLKRGYEAVIYQHPYSSMALQILKSGGTIELINIPLLKVQTPEYKIQRYNITNAYIDVVLTVRPFLNQKQFKKYLKRHFYFIDTNVFSLDIGILNPISLDNLSYNYKRLMTTMPLFSKGFFKCLLWLGFVEIRQYNRTISVLIYFMSRVKINRFSKMTYNEIYANLFSNLSEPFDLRH